jgi:putative FmdB family regulatory protein
MPIYEYRCEQCGHLVDLIQKRTDPPLETCSRCGGSMKKLLAAPALQFKGSGFYITDYSGKGKDKGKDTSDTGAPESKTAKESAPAVPAADKKTDKKSDAGGGGSAPPPVSGGDSKT